MAIAKGTQKPGQTKEQTKLVAQGIQKGIELYKKQQKAKARELDKQLKKAKQTSVDMNSGKDSESEEQNQAEVAPKSWTWVPCLPNSAMRKARYLESVKSRVHFATRAT